MPLSYLGRTLIVAGVVLVLAGALLVLAGRVGVPLGRLPGDISYRGRGFTLFAPLGTSLLLSALLSLIVYLITRFRR